MQGSPFFFGEPNSFRFIALFIAALALNYASLLGRPIPQKVA
jgi:hypothetical protein